MWEYYPVYLKRQSAEYFTFSFIALNLAIFLPYLINLLMLIFGIILLIISLLNFSLSKTISKMYYTIPFPKNMFKDITEIVEDNPGSFRIVKTISGGRLITIQELDINSKLMATLEEKLEFSDKPDVKNHLNSWIFYGFINAIMLINLGYYYKENYWILISCALFCVPLIMIGIWVLLADYKIIFHGRKGFKALVRTSFYLWWPRAIFFNDIANIKIASINDEKPTLGKKAKPGDLIITVKTGETICIMRDVITTFQMKNILMRGKLINSE